MSRREQFILYAKQRQWELFTDTRLEGEQYFYFYDLIKGNDDGSAVEIVQIALTQIDSENKSGIDIGVVYSNKIYDQNAITPEDIYREFMENN